MNMNINKTKKSELKRRTLITGLGAGIVSFAMYGKNLKKSDSKINKEKINIEIHPSAIKRNKG